MQIDAQQELESSVPKFSDNQPDRLVLHKEHSGMGDEQPYEM